MSLPVTSYKPYPVYRPSGVEWLGDVPEHWRQKRVKHVAQCLDGRRIPLNAEQRGGMQGDIPYWGANGIVDHVDKWLFDEPLVLLGEDGAPFFDRLKQVAFPVEGKVWVNNHAHVLRPAKDVLPELLAHMLNATDYRGFIDGSTRDKLTQGDMSDIPIVLPPVSEQRAIADFLDRETGRIDALIEKKRRLIELLEEKRSALISHAVTKGLDPDAPMKDSGIDWLGQIPAHWSRRKFRYLFHMTSGGTPSKNSADLWRGTIPWVSPKDMKQDIVDDSIDHVSEAALSYVSLVMPPSVLIVVRGMILTHTFPVGLGTVPLTINQDMKALRPDAETDAAFLALLLRGLAPVILALVEDSAHGTKCLRSDVLDAVQVFVPPLEEQRRIVRDSGEEGRCLDALVAKSREAIDKLQEYRTALISAAVTGRIDIRSPANG